MIGQIQTVKKHDSNVRARFSAQTELKYVVMNDEYRVHEEMGMALTPGKLLASSPRNIYQLVFLKLEKPKPPDKPCSLDCYPDEEKIDSYLTKASICWIGRQVFPSLTIIQILHTEGQKECVTLCLANRNCAMISYDLEKKLCTLRNGQFYSTGAISNTETSSSLSMECFLHIVDETRSSLCRVENPIFEVLLKSAERQMKEVFQIYHDRFADLKTAYEFNITDVKRRSKRSWETFDFMEKIHVVGWLYKVIKSPRDNKMLKEHLHALQHTFMEFTEITSRNLNNLRSFSHKVLKIIRTQNTQVSKAIEDLKCDVASVASMVAYQNILQTFQLRLQELFYAVKHGKLITDTTHILHIKDLQSIAWENEEFNNTLFSIHPEILYRVANLLLANVVNNENFLVFHFILIAPELKLENIHQTFKITQVPISTANMTSCLLTEAPEILFIKDSIYYQADVTEYEEQNDIIICNKNLEDIFSPSIKRFNCLNGNVENCIMKQVECQDEMKFTKSGALVHSKSQILGMTVGAKTTLIPLGTKGKYNYFFKWEEYKMVQTNLKVIYSLKNALSATVITINSSQASNFHDYLQKRNNELRKLNTSQLRELPEDTKEMVWEDYKPNFLGLGKSKKTIFEILTYISTFTTALSIFFILGVCCYKRSKTLNSTTKIIYEELRRQKREKQTLKRQRYLPEKSIYDEPQILEEVSLRNLPPTVVPERNCDSERNCDYTTFGNTITGVY